MDQAEHKWSTLFLFTGSLADLLPWLGSSKIFCSEQNILFQSVLALLSQQLVANIKS
jgi:hypothetical protein